MNWCMKCLLPIVALVVLNTPLRCQAQSKPYMEVQPFQEGVNERTNICDRQKLVYLDNVTVEDALRGLNLTVAFTHYRQPYEDSFFNLDENGMIPDNNPGLFVTIMDELAAEAGFEWRDSFVAIDAFDPFGENSSKTQSDLLEWEVNSFDVAVDNWAKTVNRMAKGIAFPEGWFDSSLVLVERIDPNSESVNMWSFLTPFTFPVWIMIAVAIFATGIMYWMLERLNGNSDILALEGNPLPAIFLSALTFTGNFNFQPNTHSARLLSFSWTFWALVVVSSYTANLASFLVARRTPDFKIRSIEQAVRFGVPVCVHGASNQDELLNQSYSDIMLVRKRVEREVFEGLQAGDCRVAVAPVNSYEMYVRSSDVNRDCSIKSDKRVIEILSGGFATAVDSGTLCTSLVDAALDLHLTKMIARGFMEKTWNAHLQKVGDMSCLAEEDSIPDAGRFMGGGDEDTVSLTLEEMAGIFILHAICASVALAVALVRFFLVKKKDPHDMIERLGLAKEDGNGSDAEDETAEDTNKQQHANQDSSSSHHRAIEIAGPNAFWEGVTR